MSSMTIDQLKKSLTEQGITLPPSRSKKADYIKLLEQYSSVNESLGDVYSSDDENFSRPGSQSVTSSSSPGKADNIISEVERLSDDELYHRLKNFDINIGPVLKNTRRVYEKKLIKLLRGGKQNSEKVKAQKVKYIQPVDDYSDSEVDFVPPSKKNETERSSPILGDSPKPEVEKSYSSKYEFSNRSSTPGYTNEAKSSRFSYIETIPKGSSYSYIEPDTEVGFTSDLRQRFTDRYDSDKFNSDRYSTDAFNSDRFGLNKYSTSKSNLDDIYKPSVGIGDTFKSGLGTHFKSGGFGGGDQFKSGGFGSGDHFKSGGFGSGDHFKSGGFGSSDHFKSGYGTSSQFKSSLGTGSGTQYKSGGGYGEHYTGTWEPNINRYLQTGSQKGKVTTKGKGFDFASWTKSILLGLLLLAVLLIGIYIYQQWSTADLYKLIEDDAERKIQELN